LTCSPKDWFFFWWLPSDNFLLNIVIVFRANSLWIPFGLQIYIFKLKNFCVFLCKAQGLGLQRLLFPLTKLLNHEETQQQSFIAVKKEVTFQQQPIAFFSENS
jgi:hypothetical protein